MIVELAAKSEPWQYGARTTPSLIAGNGATYMNTPTQYAPYYGNVASYAEWMSRQMLDTRGGCAPCLLGYGCGNPALNDALPLYGHGCGASYLTVPTPAVAGGLVPSPAYPWPASASTFASTSASVPQAVRAQAGPGFAARPSLASISAPGASPGGIALAAQSATGASSVPVASGCSTSFPVCNDHGQCVSASDSNAASGARCGIASTCPSTAPYCWLGVCASVDDPSSPTPQPIIAPDAQACPSGKYSGPVASGCTDQFPIAHPSGKCVTATAPFLAGPDLVAKTSNNCPLYAPYCENGLCTSYVGGIPVATSIQCPASAASCPGDQLCYNGMCLNRDGTMPNLSSGSVGIPSGPTPSMNCALAPCAPVVGADGVPQPCSLFDGVATCKEFCVQPKFQNQTAAQKALCQAGCERCGKCSLKYNQQG